MVNNVLKNTSDRYYQNRFKSLDFWKFLSQAIRFIFCPRVSVRSHFSKLKQIHTYE
jgi:hypothetical protein